MTVQFYLIQPFTVSSLPMVPRFSKVLPTSQTVLLKGRGTLQCKRKVHSPVPTAAPPTVSPVPTAGPTAFTEEFVDGEPFEIGVTIDDNEFVNEPGLLESYLLSRQTNTDVINVTFWAIGSLPPAGRRMVISDHYFNMSCWVRDVANNETVVVVQGDCQTDAYSSLGNETALSEVLTENSSIVIGANKTLTARATFASSMPSETPSMVISNDP